MEKERIDMLEDRVHYLEQLIANYDSGLTQLYVWLIIQSVGIFVIILGLL